MWWRYAKGFGREMIDKLVELARGKLNIGEDKQGNAKYMPVAPATQLTAAEALLDRGYGRPAQAIELAGKDGGPIVHESERSAYDIICRRMGGYPAAPYRGRPPYRALSSSPGGQSPAMSIAATGCMVDTARARRPGACTRHASSGRQIVRAGGATGREGHRRLPWAGLPAGGRLRPLQGLGGLLLTARTPSGLCPHDPAATAPVRKNRTFRDGGTVYRIDL